MDLGSENVCGGGDKQNPPDHTTFLSLHTLSLSDVCRETLHINDLPSEILLHLFSFFTPRQLCCALAHVCSQWHQLSRDPSLWRTLTVNSNISNANIFGSAPLQRLGRLVVLMRAETNITDWLSQIAVYCPSLSELVIFPTLQLSEPNIPVTSVTLTTLSKGCPNLRNLTLYSILVLSDRKCSGFEHFQQLEHLTLTMTVDSSNASSLDGCKRLKTLDLTIDNAIADADFRHIVGGQAAHLTHLKVFGNGGQRIAPESYHLLEHCANLETLLVPVPAQLLDDGLASLSKLRSLKRLRLGRCQITSSGLQQLFAVKTFGAQLRSLGLSAMAVTDDVLAAVADSCPSLTRLWLDFCPGITDLGVSQVIGKCSKLNWLSLHQATTVAGSFLTDIPERLPHLNHLDVKDCAIDKESDAVHGLRNAMPQLNVII